MGSAGHSASNAHKPRVGSSKFVSSTSQPTGAGGRPASAPNKRPPSPSTNQGSSSAAAPTGSQTTQNRVKYSKGKMNHQLFELEANE